MGSTTHACGLEGDIVVVGWMLLETSENVYPRLSEDSHGLVGFLNRQSSADGVGKGPNELGFQPSTPNSINCGDAPSKHLPRTRDGENDEGDDNEEQRHPQHNKPKE